MGCYSVSCWPGLATRWYILAWGAVWQGHCWPPHLWPLATYGITNKQLGVFPMSNGAIWYIWTPNTFFSHIFTKSALSEWFQIVLFGWVTGEILGRYSPNFTREILGEILVRYRLNCRVTCPAHTGWNILHCTAVIHCTVFLFYLLICYISIEQEIFYFCILPFYWILLSCNTLYGSALLSNNHQR